MDNTWEESGWQNEFLLVHNHFFQIQVLCVWKKRSYGFAWIDVFDFLCEHNWNVCAVKGRSYQNLGPGWLERGQPKLYIRKHSSH